MSDDTPHHPDGITATEFRQAVGTADWPVLGDGAHAFFPTASVAESARLVAAIAAIPGIEDHRPDIDVRPGGVTVRLLTYLDDWYGMGRRDVEVAQAISAAAAALGLRSEPDATQCVHPIVVGAIDIPRVMPFWAALLGYEARRDNPGEDLVDPRGRGPAVWFEQLEGPVAAGRNRMHVAVWVPEHLVEARRDAAIAAGGRVVYDRWAPAWWTLIDPEGNEADVASIARRE